MHQTIPGKKNGNDHHDDDYHGDHDYDDDDDDDDDNDDHDDHDDDNGDKLLYCFSSLTRFFFHTFIYLFV